MKTKLTIILLIAISAFAQTNDGTRTDRPYASIGFSYQRWTSEGSDLPLEEAVMPLMVFYPVQDNLYLTVSNTPAFARFDDIDLTGLSDTWIRATYLFYNDQLMANIGIGAPTGKTQLSVDEFALSQLLSANALRFRLPSYGQGMNAKLGLAGAFSVDEKLVLGLGFNYIYKADYEPLSGLDVRYQPGNEASIFVGFDLSRETMQWKTDFSYTFYSSDRLNGDEVFASGNKILVFTSVQMELDEGLLYASLRWRQRGKNEFWVATGLEPESQNSNGNQWEFDGRWQFIQRGLWTLCVLGEGRYFSKNDYGDQGALLYGGGMGFVYRIHPRMSLNTDLKYIMGSLRSAAEVNITGIDLSCGLRVAL